MRSTIGGRRDTYGLRLSFPATAEVAAARRSLLAARACTTGNTLRCHGHSTPPGST